MAKLPNVRESLDAIVAMPDGRNLGRAELFAVSHLPTDTSIERSEFVEMPNPHHLPRVVRLVPAGSYDDRGVPWKAHVMKDYRVQQAAIAGRVIRKDSALPPHFALDILRSNDPADDNYTVMGIVVPSNPLHPPRSTGHPTVMGSRVPFNEHSYGIKAIGIIRPDVVKFSDGEPHIKLWFNALVDPAYNRAGNRAYLTTAGRQLVMDALVSAAMKRMETVAGNDALVFSDDQCSLGIDELVNGHGFKVLLEGVQVSSLPEKRKSKLDTAVSAVTLLVKPNRAYVEGMPPNKASEMVKNYLVDGYEAPENGKLVRQALAQLNAQVAQGLVRYR